MKNKINYIITDLGNADTRWNLYKELCKLNCGEWQILSYGSKLKSGGRLMGRLRVLMYFLYPLTLVSKVRNAGIVFAHQQFYGLNLALYLRLLRWKNLPRIVVCTFIYKPKGSNFIGRFYHKYIKFILQSRCCKTIIVRSTTEIKYYEDLFEVRGKFAYVPFSMYSRAPHDVAPNEERYLLGIGRSNRDWKFLIDNLANTKYKAKIACDTYYGSVNNNVEVLKDCFGDKMHQMLAKCYAVVIPLQDTNISAGQMVFLEAMEFGKPVIVTESTGVTDYIQNGDTGILIHNTKEELISAIEKLYNDNTFYRRLSKNAQVYVRATFTPQKSDERLASVIKAIIS